MQFSIDEVIKRFEKIETDFGIELTPEVIYMATCFLRKYKRIADVLDDYNNSGCCGDEQDIDHYFTQILDTFKEPDVAPGVNTITPHPCRFCDTHCLGDTLYESSDWDGGIGFDYIRNIKYCPLCGRKLY